MSSEVIPAGKIVVDDEIKVDGDWMTVKGIGHSDKPNGPIKVSYGASSFAPGKFETIRLYNDKQLVTRWRYQ